MQKFIPVIEKYCDLHLGGHQHNFSATKPLYTGYNGTDAYNFYYDNNQSPKLQAALADESAINKKGDLAKGVRYLSQNATGYKCSGKQTNLNSIDQYSSNAVAGVEGDTNIDYYSDSFLPW